MQSTYYAQDVDEDEILGDGEVDFGVDYAGQADIGDDVNTAIITEAQQRQAQKEQQQQQAAALSAVPEPVKRYIVGFHQAVQNGSLQEIAAAHEGSWSKLTDKFYAKSEWPEAEVIAPLVQDDQLFLTLYRELWFRHVYARLSPAGEDRFNSYDNYCDFFNYVLNSDGPVDLDLPAQWLWDIVDEFIYQFQSYAQWRNKVSGKTEDELALLQDGGVWSSYSVLNVLYSLIQKSKIIEQLAAAERGEDPTEAAGDFGNKPLYKLLGYFSVIGLLRVHVLLGDYTLALKMLDQLDLHKKNSLVTRVTACHVATYYYIGFAYMMLGRYPDAIKSFTHILVFIMRLRQYHSRNSQYDQINKTGDRMYALLAICCALSPTRLDENLQTIMRDKNGEQMARMAKGNHSAFEELFIYAGPKFITNIAPPYDDAEALASFDEKTLPDPLQHQVKVFLAGVSGQSQNGDVRSLIRLYKSLGAQKLADFLGVDEETIYEIMMVNKRSTRRLKWNEGGLLEGDAVNTSDLDFNIDDDMVNVAEVKVGRRYGDWFLRNGTRMHEVTTAFKAKPLPSASAATPAPTAQANANRGPAGARPPRQDFKPAGAWGNRAPVAAQ